MSQKVTKYAVRFHINIEGNDIDDVDISNIDYLQQPTMNELTNAATRQLSHYNYHLTNYQISFMDGDNECDQDEDVKDAWSHWLDISDDEEAENIDINLIKPLQFNIILEPKANINSPINILSDDSKQCTSYPVVFQICIQGTDSQQMCNIQYLSQPQFEQLQSALIQELSNEEQAKYKIKTIMEYNGVELEDDDDVETAFDEQTDDNDKPKRPLFLKVILVTKEPGDVKENNIMFYRQLLQSWNLSQFADKLAEDGWDDPLDWKELTNNDLQNDIGFGKGHIIRFRKKYQEWLNLNGEQQEEKKMDPITISGNENNTRSWKPTSSIERTYSALINMGFSHNLSMEAAGKCFDQIDEAINWVIQQQSMMNTPQNDDISQNRIGNKHISRRVQPDNLFQAQLQFEEFQQQLMQSNMVNDDNNQQQLEGINSISLQLGNMGFGQQLCMEAAVRFPDNINDAINWLATQQPVQQQKNDSVRSKIVGNRDAINTRSVNRASVNINYNQNKSINEKKLNHEFADDCQSVESCVALKRIIGILRIYKDYDKSEEIAASLSMLQNFQHLVNDCGGARARPLGRGDNSCWRLTENFSVAAGVAAIMFVIGRFIIRKIKR